MNRLKRERTIEEKQKRENSIIDKQTFTKNMRRIKKEKYLSTPVFFFFFSVR